MTTATRTNIGRLACFQLLNDDGQAKEPKVYGNVLDLVAGTSNPKRIRLQRGLPEFAGEVFFPSQYRFCWWADEEED